MGLKVVNENFITIIFDNRKKASDRKKNFKKKPPPESNVIFLNSKLRL